MKVKESNKKISRIIKIISTVLIISAIELELWNIYATTTENEIPQLDVIIWVERLALLIHFIEGILAAFYAYLRGKNPIKQGIYTFFTGTVSLLELFD